MSRISTKIYQPFDTGADQLLEHITNILDQVRRRAFDLSTMRGQEGLNELDDWVQAERELHACQRSDVREEADRFVTEVDAADFEPRDLKVSLLGNDLIIEGESRTETKVDGEKAETIGRSIMVRAFLSDAFDPATLSAELHEGVLRVTAEKRHAQAAGSQPEQMKVSSATA
jgi:HSP20 family molecular chaperone IbpA